MPDLHSGQLFNLNNINMADRRSNFNSATDPVDHDYSTNTLLIDLKTTWGLNVL